MSSEEMIKECVTPNEEVSKRVGESYSKGREKGIDELLKEFFNMYCGYDDNGFIGKNCVSKHICSQSVCYYKLLEQKAKNLKEM